MVLQPWFYWEVLLGTVGFLQGFVEYGDELQGVAAEILAYPNDQIVQQLQSCGSFFHCQYADPDIGWFKDSEEHANECIYCPGAFHNPILVDNDSFAADAPLAPAAPGLALAAHVCHPQKKMFKKKPPPPPPLRAEPPS